MAYKIEQRGLETIVIDVTTGKECGHYASRAAAVQAIVEIGQQPRLAVDTNTGKSRSSIYREANTPGTSLNVLKTFFPRKGEIKRNTEKWYYAMPIWGGADPATVKKHHQELTKQLNRSAASRVANAPRRKRADQRAEMAKALEAQGKTQKEIAAAVGLKSTRGVRKLLTRAR